MTIDQIIREGTSQVKTTFCSFQANIMSIENKREPYYNACKKCYSKVDMKEGVVECYKCKKIDVECNQRYILKLIVTDGEQSIKITIFDDSEMLIGCPVSEYMSMNGEKDMQSKFNRNLISCVGKKYEFYTKANKISEDDRAMGRWIAQYIERIDDVEHEDINKDDGCQNKRRKL
ncbi:hypothetical protein QJS04_geneDACA023593 [Acorus gramineus]|uniref:Replication factor A C-terminal domain-containing protein n=1 Tax=Acorus gramineus TaxID=55184 RepID=A0AAV9AK46_ACOGR|nr:hypothetical protein QJS04_geneDACA023593 [Acorus gramineus]